MKQLTFIFSNLLIITQVLSAQDIPAVYQNLYYDVSGKLYLEVNGGEIYSKCDSSVYTLQQMQAKVSGTKDGLDLKFGNGTFNGTLYFGFIDYTDGKFPQTVFFKRTAPIKKGKASIVIKELMSGKYDMIGWEKTHFGTLGYRVANLKGEMLYDGRIGFEVGEMFKPIPTITEGPFINLLSENGCVISFKTTLPVNAEINIGNLIFSDESEKIDHEIAVTDLDADNDYTYRINYGKLFQEYTFHTAPKAGSQEAFTFGYISDSRQGQGGGERSFYGVNTYIIKKAMAMAANEDVAFVQFTGDMISGYGQVEQDMDLQYTNWKMAISPFAAYFPVIAGMGNHESYGFLFGHPKEKKEWYLVDHFPFETQSGEALFAKHFVNPHNGPFSEDGSACDPNKNKIDFPPYDETVFSYTYANCAFIVLNSNYLYTPSMPERIITGGNIHAYIMDNQLQWLKDQLLVLEQNGNIDHIFITIHTPAFPNGGHANNDMWYYGENGPRPIIDGDSAEFGIIERRDQFLDLMINKSTKVAALLTGDEHNYNYLPISEDMPRYPENWQGEKLKLSRKILQINNGAAGAPYYAQEELPWSAFTQSFSTQNALVLISVKGKKITAVVKNPDTLETFDEFVIR